MTRNINISFTLKDIEANRCKDSFYYFVIKCFPILNPSTVFINNWHIKYLCGELQREVERINKGIERKYSAIVINLPFRSLKSEIASIMFPVWTWLINSSLKMICVSYSQILSDKFSDAFRRIIDSKWFQYLFGDEFKLIKDNIREVKNNKAGARFASSVTGTITGDGGNINILDDPQSPKLVTSKTGRRATIEFYKNTMSNRLNNVKVDINVIIQQRLHNDDLSGFLIKEHGQDIKRICIPGENTGLQILPNIEEYNFGEIYKNNSFFDGMFGEAQRKYYRDILRNQYNAQFLQNPVSEEGNMFAVKDFPIMSIGEFEIMTRNRNLHPDAFFDGAYTAKKENDPSALAVAYHFEKKVYIMFCESVYINSNELADYIAGECNRNGFTHRSCCYVEPKASGKTVVQQAQKDAKINVLEYKFNDNAGVNINSAKVERANAIKMLVAVVVPTRYVLSTAPANGSPLASKIGLGTVDNLVKLILSFLFAHDFYGNHS